MDSQPTPQTTNSLDNFFNVSLDAATRSQIRQAAVWARVTAICAFGAYAITLIVAFFGRVAALDDSAIGIEVNDSFRINRIIGALITAVIGVIINLFLYRFSQSTIRGIDAMDNVLTNDGFNQLRRYFKILGILLIVAFSLVILGILIGIGVGLSRTSSY